MEKSYTKKKIKKLLKKSVKGLQASSVKGLLTVSALAFMGFTMNAQTDIARYKFSKSTGNTYVPITGGTVVFSGSYDNSVSSAIPLPTPFPYGGTTVSNVFINSNGFISFGAAISASTYTPLSTSGTNVTGVISAFGQDGGNSAAAGATSEISYKDLGTEFVVQFKDHANYFNSSSEKLNFQIRLNYSTGEINIVYGQCTNPGTNTSGNTPQVGIRGNSTTWASNVNNLMIANAPTGTVCDWSKAVAGSANSSTMIFSSGTNANIVIPTGLKYTWVPGTQLPVRTFVAPSAINAYGATLGWTAPTGATSYNLQYRKLADCDWVDFPGAISGATATLTGLEPLNTYQVRVKATNGTEESIYSHIMGNTATTHGYSTTGTFTTLAPCAGVSTALTSSNITINSATISWTAPSAAPPAGYEYYYSTSSTAPTYNTVASGNVGPGVTTVDLTSLSSSTKYYYWVRTSCGTDKGAWVGGNFTTLCGVMNAPFSQTFSDGALPICWTNQNPTTSSTSTNVFWKFTGNADYGVSPTFNNRPSGTFAWVDASSPYDNEHTVELLTPQINLAGLARPYVSFDWFKNHSSSSANVTLPTNYDNNKLSVDINDGNGWVNLFESSTNASVWRTEGVSLPASYVGATVQLRFTVDKNIGSSPYYYDDILLDNVEVKEAPACMPPSGLDYNNLTTTGATVIWNAPSASNPSGYDIYYSNNTTLPTATTTPSATSTTTSVTLAGAPGQVFNVWVRSNCGGSQSNWVGPVNYTIPFPLPVNDECTDAVTLTVNPDLTCTTFTSGYTQGATASGVSQGNCGGTPDDDVWYKFTATNTAHIVSLTNIVSTGTTSTTDMYMQVLSGACGSMTTVACSDPETVSLPGLTVGETYYVRVYTYGGAGRSASFNICVTTEPSAPANDDCSGAIPLVPGANFAQNAVIGHNFSTTSTTGVNYACQTSRSKDVWYSVTVPASGSITIETDTVTGSGFTDSVLEVFSGTCGSLVSVGCDDDGGNGNFSKVQLSNRTPGEVLLVGVWSYGTSGNSGQFQVSAYDSSLLSTSENGVKKDQLKLYPNPFVDVLNISDVTKVKSLSIADVAGRVVRKIDNPKSSIALNELASGMYIVILEMKDGSKQSVKVIKK